ncbi:YciI family protein [Roseibium salinum]|uniref:YciI family protein n=1 Tax=Roseibium salinum TaxID=1604349 RepID=A0ABT3R7P8_9HYPH|nr:YciI family protein [Roseibium sp. DSM 29163]MCX2725158.1 YciI family protein [Roseibium sp. DSM 29163]MDN3720962.1 YciI family protein [Roseibium salinum]
MLYALICTDKPGALQTRLDNRAAHLEFLNGLGDSLKAAGPFLDDDGNMTGSLVVIEASSRDEILAISQEDPYAGAGLFESVEIRPWNWAVKNPEAK